jgi:predicted DCC family thiol-disulfide oxidoreductase YuxK
VASPLSLPSFDVLIDGACPICRRTAGYLRALDWFHRLTFVDADNDRAREAAAPGLSRNVALASMHVKRHGSGTLTSGYDGYLQLAQALPLLWPSLLVGALPGVRHIGRAVYRKIAASRTRVGRCTDAVCGDV